jgi:methionyl-tRNA formyltransferase
MGAPLIVRTLADLDSEIVEPRPQPSEGVTIASKVEADEARLDPSLPAVDLERRVRAFDPAPGAFLTIGPRRVKVWRVRAVEGSGPSATIAAVTDDEVDVQTSEGRLRLLEVQPEGKRRMSASEFARGYRPGIGDSIG